MKLIVSDAMLMSLATFFTALSPSLVDGHAFMSKPKTRNAYASVSGTWNSEAGVPPAESTPQGLNSNTGTCGKSGGTKDYDIWLDSLGTPMPWMSQDTFSKGEVIDVNVAVTAHHYGHFEVKACAMGSSSTQDCFDANPLTFVKDVSHGMPPDEKYPGRAMLWGNGVNISYKFRLPPNVAGEKVLLQYVYWTANNCNYDGYEEYFATHSTPPSSKGNWNPGISDCGPIERIPMIRTGTVIAEIFVNCAEISISGEPTPTPPVRPPSPRPPSPIPAPVQAPVQSPVDTSPIEPGTIGTCGGGNRGNGICPVISQCCSSWGHCGSDAAYCDSGDNTTPVTTPVTAPVQAPVQAPVDTSPTTPGGGDVGDSLELGDSRLIAYIGNWQTCPSDEQMAQYTHVVIAFAVSYQYAETGNICSETCEIASPPVCENAAHPDLIEKWKAAGKKVILSFGGAGMGGSWNGKNRCWDHCFGREAQVVDRLTEIVNDMDLDGVDIDYEYFYEDNQNGSDFTKGSEAQKFLKDVTLGLRNKMPEGSELTHAPMEPDVVPGKAYFDVLKEVASSLDFLMPQYYNGYVHSSTNFPGALSHFTAITNQIFGGDASKVVYGFCISDCDDFNLDGYQSADVMEKLSDTYPCNGGAFFWVAYDDIDGAWSKPMEGQLGLNSATCADPDRPAPPPVQAPVRVPRPVQAPIQRPTSLNPGSPGEPGGSSGDGGDSSSNGCCSQNFKTCASWGNESKEVCDSYGSMIWLEEGALGDDVCTLMKDASCRNNPDGCCPGLVCEGTQYYKQCKMSANTE